MTPPEPLSRRTPESLMSAQPADCDKGRNFMKEPKEITSMRRQVAAYRKESMTAPNRRHGRARA